MAISPSRAVRRASKGGQDVNPQVSSSGSTPSSGTTPSSGMLASYHEVKSEKHWHWIADNEAITSGYRLHFGPWETFLSLFRLHNETVNVWTHLGGALVFLVLLVELAFQPQLGGAGSTSSLMLVGLKGMETTFSAGVDRVVAVAAAAARVDDGSVGEAGLRTVPQWPIAVFICSAIICMGCSATFHLYHSLSKFWYTTLSSLDYASIAILIAGSTVPPVYYGFWCSPAVGNLYLAACGGIALVTMGIGLTPFFRTEAWRLVRMSSFIATGAFGGVPLLHLVLSSVEQYSEAVEGLLVMGALYIFGALLYGYRVPERFFPGRFDLLGASHQIFHVCVFAACCVHFRTVCGHYQWRMAHPTCAV